MCILYEIGILAAQVFVRKTQAPPEKAAPAEVPTAEDSKGGSP
jgi:hypothetical protein